MSTITVVHVINGTTHEDTHTAERITYQHWPDGRAQIRLWTGATVTEVIGYRQAEKIHRRDQALRDEWEDA